MRLIWAVSCRSYDPQPDGTVDIEGAAIDELWTAELPAVVEVTVLVRVGMVENEEADLQVELLAHDGSLVDALDLTMHGVPGPFDRPGYEVKKIQPVYCRFDAESEGIYSTEIFMDGKREHSLFFSVREGLPPSH